MSPRHKKHKKQPLYYTPSNVNPQIFNFLRSTMIDALYQERNVILTFAEYVVSDILPEGYITPKEEDILPPDKCVIFGIRKVHSNVTQPIGTVFYHEQLAKELAYSVTLFVSALRLVGLNVIASVSPATDTLVECVCRLSKISSIYYHEDVISYVVDQGEGIVHIFDPPSLIKDIRNVFSSNILHFEKDGLTFIADADYIHVWIEGHMERQDQYADKLYLSSVKALNSSYAMRIFSRSLVKGMCDSLFEDELHLVSLGTMEFLIFFNDLMDSFNTSRADRTGLRSPITRKSKHVKFWDQALDILKTMKLVINRQEVAYTRQTKTGKRIESGESSKASSSKDADVIRAEKLKATMEENTEALNKIGKNIKKCLEKDQVSNEEFNEVLTQIDSIKAPDLIKSPARRNLMPEILECERKAQAKGKQKIGKSAPRKTSKKLTYRSPSPNSQIKVEKSTPEKSVKKLVEEESPPKISLQLKTKDRVISLDIKESQMTAIEDEAMEDEAYIDYLSKLQQDMSSKLDRIDEHLDIYEEIEKTTSRDDNQRKLDEAMRELTLEEAERLGSELSFPCDVGDCLEALLDLSKQSSYPILEAIKAIDGERSNSEDSDSKEKQAAGPSSALAHLGMICEQLVEHDMGIAEDSNRMDQTGNSEPDQEQQSPGSTKEHVLTFEEDKEAELESSNKKSRKKSKTKAGSSETTKPEKSLYIELDFNKSGQTDMKLKQLQDQQLRDTRKVLPKPGKKSKSRKNSGTSSGKDQEWDVTKQKLYDKVEHSSATVSGSSYIELELGKAQDQTKSVKTKPSKQTKSSTTRTKLNVSDVLKVPPKKVVEPSSYTTLDKLEKIVFEETRSKEAEKSRPTDLDRNEEKEFDPTNKSMNIRSKAEQKLADKKTASVKITFPDTKEAEMKQKSLDESLQTARQFYKRGMVEDDARAQIQGKETKVPECVHLWHISIMGIKKIVENLRCMGYHEIHTKSFNVDSTHRYVNLIQASNNMEQVPKVSDEETFYYMDDEIAQLAIVPYVGSCILRYCKD